MGAKKIQDWFTARTRGGLCLIGSLTFKLIALSNLPYIYEYQQNFTLRKKVACPIQFVGH